MGMGGKHLAPAILPLGKGLITLLQEAVWAPVSLWTGVENPPL